MHNLKSKGISALIWEFTGRIATNGTGFVVTIILARLLEPSDFGLIAMIMVIIGFARVFTDVGLGSALVQRRKVLPIHYSSVFYFNIFVGFLLTLITYFSASSIGDFFNNDNLIPLAQVMSLSFIINSFSSVQSTILKKELNYAILTKAKFIASFISSVVAVLLAFNGAGVWSLVAQTLIMGMLYNILIWTTAAWVPNLKFSWKALTQLWGFGFRIFLVGLINAAYGRMDYLIIGKLFAPATLGFFQRAKSLNMIAKQYSSASLASVLFPMLSKIQNNLPRYQNYSTKGLAIISFISAFLFGSLYLVSEELIVILFSEKWLQSVEYFKILAISGFTHPINTLLSTVLKSRGNSRATLRLTIYKQTIGFLNIGVIFIYGIKGYLYGLVIVAIINTSMSIIMASRECKLPISGFYKPIVIQVLIVVLSILSTLYISGSMNFSMIGSLIVKELIFIIIFFLINMAFKTASYNYFLEQFVPVIKKVSNKVSKKLQNKR